LHSDEYRFASFAEPKTGFEADSVHPSRKVFHGEITIFFRAPPAAAAIWVASISIQPTVQGNEHRDCLVNASLDHLWKRTVAGMHFSKSCPFWSRKVHTACIHLTVSLWVAIGGIDQCRIN
jgi:hypothetical protein